MDTKGKIYRLTPTPQGNAPRGGVLSLMCNKEVWNMKMRIALKIEYRGTNYCGWQIQPNGDTVQERLENALRELTGQQLRVHGSGRTDAGVHALGQVAHFDVDSAIPPERFAFALNQKLPSDISISQSYVVANDFHARFNAKGKHYCYGIYNSPCRSAIYKDFYMHVPKLLDVNAMREGARLLVGEHDFASFCAVNSSVQSTVRIIHSLDITQNGHIVKLDVKGNGFLYNMVRIIAGTLIDIGLHKYQYADLLTILEKRDRNAAGATAKACGLVLMEVFY